MNIADQLLEKAGLNYEKLTTEEKETYFKMAEVASAKPISVEDLKTFIESMVTGLQNELVDSKDGTDESKQLKSRLKNMIVIQNFLLSPTRAKQSLERYYKNFKL